MWFLNKQIAHVDIVNRSQGFDVRKGQTILDAAIEMEIDFPHQCMVGACGTCKCLMVEGRVRQRTEAAYALTAEEIDAGYVLGCQSEPVGAIRISLADLEEE